MVVSHHPCLNGWSCNFRLWRFWQTAPTSMVGSSNGLWHCIVLHLTHWHHSSNNKSGTFLQPCLSFIIYSEFLLSESCDELFKSCSNLGLMWSLSWLLGIFIQAGLLQMLLSRPMAISACHKHSCFLVTSNWVTIWRSLQSPCLLFRLVILLYRSNISVNWLYGS